MWKIRSQHSLIQKGLPFPNDFSVLLTLKQPRAAARTFAVQAIVVAVFVGHVDASEGFLERRA